MNIQPVLDYIKENFRSELKATELAKKFRLNRFNFSKTFNREVGQSFDRYIQGLRFSESRRLIDEGKSPKEACFESGFQSESQFQRVFRQRNGLSPKEYRKAGIVERWQIEKELQKLLAEYIQCLNAGVIGWGLSFKKWLEVNNHYFMIGNNKFKKIRKAELKSD